MAEAARPDDAFAIGNDEQYRPVQAVADQRVRVSGPAGTGLLACHASRPLGDSYRGPVVVVVHGALRDSDRYLASAQHAARLADSDILIVAPQFLAGPDRLAGTPGGSGSGPDRSAGTPAGSAGTPAGSAGTPAGSAGTPAGSAGTPAGSAGTPAGSAGTPAGSAGTPEGVLYWEVEGWKGGYPALGPAPLSSFAAMDSLLAQVAPTPGHDPDVVVFGNSAGGQFVNRYAAVGRGPDVLAERGLRVRFVISNPSTYLYFNQDRPIAVPNGAHVNDWRYGFDGAPGYVDANAQRCLERYLGRDVTIVLGTLDNDGASLLLEVSPAAMAQGVNRFDRGVRYDQHVRRLARAAGLPARHRLIQLAGVGHTAGDVLADGAVREVVFG